MAVPEERHENVVDFAEAKKSAGRTEHAELEDTKKPDLAEQAMLQSQVRAGHDFVNALGVLASAVDSEITEGEVLEILDQALEKVLRVTSSKDAALLIRDDVTGDLVFALAWGDMPKSELLWKRVPKGQGVAHWVADNRRPAIVNDVSSDERFYAELDRVNSFRTRSILAAPLLNGEEVLGVVEVLNKQGSGYFTLNDQNHLTLLAHLASVVLAELGKRKA